MDPSPPASRRSSFASQAASTRHILSDMNPSHLEPPHAPFISPTRSGSRNSSLGSNSPSVPLSRESSSISLTVNYLPKKFSSTMLNAGNPRRRKNAGVGKDIGAGFPKRGGGVEAFRSGESRMPNPGDDDDASTGWLSAGKKKKKKKLRWNRFKWTLFFTNLILTIYTVTGLIICLLTWFNVFKHADVLRAANRAELVLSTLAAICGLFTSLLGWAGILLNNRSFLAIYTFLTWVTFALLVIPGYVSYKKHTFNLEGKVNAQWSRDLGVSGRLRVQNELQCCGYYNPFIEATVSATCYSRSVLPGCKSLYLKFERNTLRKFYTAAFGLVPVQIMIMVAALLCSNHVTYRFGKGMMPKAYRLSLNSMAVIMDQYASQLAEQYGQDVASSVLARSRGNLLLDSMPTMPYQSPTANTAVPVYHAKYDSIGARTPDTVS
ncbi:hypothetical protein AX15_007531 [Amanita polypyramis BW_CC]|nr:hypothetical protein AX15_007531 [Amanita polypyramis BW_CC]